MITTKENNKLSVTNSTNINILELADKELKTIVLRK